MKIDGIVVDTKMKDCFGTLGIEPTSNLNLIKCAYKDMIMMVHPDRIRRSGLKWTKDECNMAFNNVRSSYKYLISQFSSVDLPDFDVLYSVGEFDEGENERFFDIEKFNRDFDNLKKEKNDVDYNRGYKKFERDVDDVVVPSDHPIGKDEFDDALDEEQLCREIEKTYVIDDFNKEKCESHTLMKQLPDCRDEVFGFSILGDSPENFEGVSSSNGVSYSDLNQVFGTNHEFWEKTISQDDKILKKFINNNELLNKRLQNFIKERNNVDSIKLTVDDYKKINDKKRINLEKEEKRHVRYTEQRLKNI